MHIKRDNCGAGGAMFEVLDYGQIWGAYVVRGLDGFSSQTAVFLGPEARQRAEAYARWLNAGAAHQRRRAIPATRANPLLIPSAEGSLWGGGPSGHQAASLHKHTRLAPLRPHPRSATSAPAPTCIGNTVV